METRLPAEGSFGNNFPSNCHKTFEENFPLTGKFKNTVPKEFIAIAIDLLCSNFVKFG